MLVLDRERPHLRETLHAIVWQGAPVDILVVEVREVPADAIVLPEQIIDARRALVHIRGIHVLVHGDHPLREVRRARRLRRQRQHLRGVAGVALLQRYHHHGEPRRRLGQPAGEEPRD